MQPAVLKPELIGRISQVDLAETAKRACSRWFRRITFLLEVLYLAQKNNLLLSIAFGTPYPITDLDKTIAISSIAMQIWKMICVAMRSYSSTNEPSAPEAWQRVAGHSDWISAVFLNEEITGVNPLLTCSKYSLTALM